MQNPSHTKAQEVGVVNREGERLVVSKISVKIAKAKKSLIAYTKIQESSNLQISIISPIWQLLTKLLKRCNCGGFLIALRLLNILVLII